MRVFHTELGTIKHAHHDDAGKIYNWLGEDNQANFQRHLADVSLHARLSESGWLDTPITYSFNRQGFRSPEFDPDIPHICVFGCSATFGMAINYDQRYGDMLAKDLGLTCYNFGVSGGSDSTSFRLAAAWLHILNPKFVVFQSTFPERFEIIQDNHAHVLGINAALGGDIPIGQGDLYKIWITNESNAKILAVKNLLAMRYLCHELGHQLIEIDITDFFGQWPTVARDTHHPGLHANRHVADLVRARI